MIGRAELERIVRERARVLAVAAGVVAAGGLAAWCGCGSHGAGSGSARTGADARDGGALAAGAAGAANANAAAIVAVPPGEDLWASAKASDYEADDLARLADREGAGGLVEGVKADPSRRRAAVLALAFTGDDGFVGLPYLAEVAATGDEADARAAVESADRLAARPRRAVDPEDAPELRAGCDRMLVVAKDPARPRAVRVGAVRALKMLEDRGCVRDGDLPAELNTKQK